MPSPSTSSERVHNDAGPKIGAKAASIVLPNWLVSSLVAASILAIMFVFAEFVYPAFHRQLVACSVPPDLSFSARLVLGIQPQYWVTGAFVAAVLTMAKDRWLPIRRSAMVNKIVLGTFLLLCGGVTWVLLGAIGDLASTLSK